MLTGGADELMPLMINGFAAMGQLRRYASAFGEGSGILVLEGAAHAARRGATVRAKVESVATIGLFPAGHECEGAERLLEASAACDLVSLSGTAVDTRFLTERIHGKPFLDTGRTLGSSLAMGGTAMAAMLSSLEPGREGLHLAASPEGPYYAIRFSGGLPA